MFLRIPLGEEETLLLNMRQVAYISHGRARITFNLTGGDSVSVATHSVGAEVVGQLLAALEGLSIGLEKDPAEIRSQILRGKNFWER